MAPVSSNYQSPKCTTKGGILTLQPREACLHYNPSELLKVKAKNARLLAFLLTTVAITYSHGNQPPNSPFWRQISQMLCVMTVMRFVPIPGGKKNSIAPIDGILLSGPRLQDMQRWKVSFLIKGKHQQEELRSGQRSLRSFCAFQAHNVGYLQSWRDHRMLFNPSRWPSRLIINFIF